MRLSSAFREEVDAARQASARAALRESRHSAAHAVRSLDFRARLQTRAGGDTKSAGGARHEHMDRFFG
jgi:hypothetical protein